MKCPNCNETLLMSERYQVEVDYCPKCRGIWLDKGELDKIINYVDNEHNDESSKSYSTPNQWNDYNGKSDYHDKHDQQRPYKKKSFLSNLFDFD
ncbi:zf-TFIIB domain-containing protein [Olivibacter sp. CPCC 100613]|uniref:TFIIB-type zinc ribbon-containing protein n=1 Tax=Olivibacter sp. CPCC 100613 TaxID=3079931 RepID=UPI002FFA7DE0